MVSWPLAVTGSYFQFPDVLDSCDIYRRYGVRIVDKNKVLEEIERMKDEMVELLREFIKIPTENPPGDNYERFMDFMGASLKEFGYDVTMIKVPYREDLSFPSEKGRVNLYAKLSGEGEKPRIHLNGHVDTVPAGDGWSVNPFGGEIKDGRIYGRGASDMKSGLVAQIFAVEALRRAGIKLKGTIEQSAVVDEETVGNKNAGMYYLVEKGIISKEKTDYVIITEPLDPDRVCLGHRGALRFQMETFGKQAHGAMPYSGINAGIKMANFLTLIDKELIPKIKERKTATPVVPEEAKRSSLSLGMLSAGSATNLVPSRAIATFDRRLNPEEDLDGARKEFYRCAEAFAMIDPEFKYKIKELYATSPVVVSEDQPIVEALKEGIKSIYGKKAQMVLSPGTDDQRFVVNNAGINSCVLYGPGRLEEAHVSDEHIDIQDLINGTKVLAIAVGTLMERDEKNRVF
jgi:succinyl-diaminopimelate desuccinylase